MHVRDLTLEERHVLFGMLARVAAADGEISTNEILELEELGDEMGVEPLKGALAEARARYPTVESLLEGAARFDRPDAIQLVRTLLLDLAHADGDRTGDEIALVDQFLAPWAEK